MDTMPLKGMATLVAEIVKLGAGVAAGTCAAHRPQASPEKTTKHVSVLFLVITETSSA
jgi:hypothetical protein